MPETILQLYQAERALQSYPGRTLAELADTIGADRSILRERLLDLEASGKAHCAEVAVCRVTGRPAPVWRAGRDPAELASGYAQAGLALTPPEDPRAPELFA